MSTVIGYLLRRWNPDADERHGDYDDWADEHFHREVNARAEATRRNRKTLSELNARRRAPLGRPDREPRRRRSADRRRGRPTPAEARRTS